MPLGSILFLCSSIIFFSIFPLGRSLVGANTYKEYLGYNKSHLHPHVTSDVNTLLSSSKFEVSALNSALQIADMSGRYANLNSFASLPLPAYDENPFNLVSEGSIYIGGGLGTSSTYLYFSDSVFNIAWFTTGFTIEAWIYFTSTASASNTLYPGLIGAMLPSGNAQNSWSFGPIRGPDGIVRLRLYAHVPNGASIWLNGTSTLSVNAWHHIALSVVSSGAIRMFANGALDGSFLNPGTIAAVNDIGLSIGQCNEGVGSSFSAYFQGYVSNLRFVQNNALYTAAFNPPTSPLSAINNTLLLLRSYGTHPTISPTRTPTAIPTVVPSARPTFGGSIITLELVDTSGNYANINSFSNAALQVHAEDPFSLPSEGSLLISGSSTGSPYFLSMTNSAFNIAWLSEGFTVEAWIFVGPVSSLYPALVGSMSSSAATNYWSFGPVLSQSSGLIQLRFQYNPSGNSAQFVNGTTALSANAWQHVALSVSAGGSSILMFVNGKVDATGSAVGSVSTASSSGLSIGRYNGGVAADVRSGYFQGYVSSLRLTRGVAVYTSDFTVSTSSPLQVLPSTMMLLRATTNPGLSLVDRSGRFLNVQALATAAVNLSDSDPFLLYSEGSFFCQWQYWSIFFFASY